MQYARITPIDGKLRVRLIFVVFSQSGTFAPRLLYLVLGLFLHTPLGKTSLGMPMECRKGETGNLAPGKTARRKRIGRPGRPLPCADPAVEVGKVAR